MKTSMLVALLPLLLAGCQVVVIRHGAIESQARLYDRQALARECRRVRCSDPDEIAVSHFTRLAQEHRGGCVVHVVPPAAGDVTRDWQRHTAAITHALRPHHVHAIAYVSSSDVGGRSREAERLTARVLRGYGLEGRSSPRWSTQYTHQTGNLRPPYRSGPCREAPVLELSRGARLMSSYASPQAERAMSEERLRRTVLVVLR